MQPVGTQGPVRRFLMCAGPPSVSAPTACTPKSMAAIEACHRGLHLFGNFLFWKIASLIVRTRSIELKLDSVVHLLQRLVGEALAVNAKKTLPRRALVTERPHVITFVPSSNLCWRAVYLTGVSYL